MMCNKCGKKSYVTKTFFKKDFTIRYRQCSKCGNKFKTKEQISYGWDDRAVLRKVKELVKDVK
jgi:ribosomal protein L37E